MAAQRIVHDSSSSSSGFVKSEREERRDRIKSWFNRSSSSSENVEEVETDVGQFSPSALPPGCAEERNETSRLESSSSSSGSAKMVVRMIHPISLLDRSDIWFWRQNFSEECKERLLAFRDEVEIIINGKLSEHFIERDAYDSSTLDKIDKLLFGYFMQATVEDEWAVNFFLTTNGLDQLAPTEQNQRYHCRTVLDHMCINSFQTMIVNENETTYNFSTRYENHKKFLCEYTSFKIGPSKNIPHFLKVIKEAFPLSSEFISTEN